MVELRNSAHNMGKAMRYRCITRLFIHLLNSCFELLEEEAGEKRESACQVMESAYQKNEKSEQAMSCSSKQSTNVECTVTMFIVHAS